MIDPKEIAQLAVPGLGRGEVDLGAGDPDR